MKRRLAIALTAGALALGTPIMAHADSCANVSRAAPTNYVPGSGPLVEGNWVWLPSIGVPVEAWGFAPPGGPDSTAFGMPGANGNYTNGATSSLLGQSANCPPGANPSRQTDHGIQTGCE
jgi:hypothetical protein